MIPFILLSLSGSSIHMHYCGHEDKLYADVHMASLRVSGEHKCAGYVHDQAPESASEKTCGQDATMNHASTTSAESCCSPSPVNTCEEKTMTHDDCCVDVEQPVTTDDDYKSSQFNHKTEITEIHLPEDHSFFHVATHNREPLYISNDQNIPDSPDLTRLGTLLL